MEYHGAPLSCIFTDPLVFVASLPNAFNQPSIAELSTNRFSRHLLRPLIELALNNLVFQSRVFLTLVFYAAKVLSWVKHLKEASD